MNDTTSATLSPPAPTQRIFTRNAYGLVEGVDYLYNDDGSINWRAMVKPEHLYVNKEHFKKRNQDVPPSIEGLPDEALLIKLAGIKQLSKLRGIKRSYLSFPRLGDGYVVAQSTIHWVENFENPEEVVTEDVGNATDANCGPPFNGFLETIASNRAFVRNVRTFLNINVVGADELEKGNIEKKVGGVNPVSAQGVLMAKFQEVHSSESFDDFKEILRKLWKEEKYKNDDVKVWAAWTDVPAKEARKLLGILSEA